MIGRALIRGLIYFVQLFRTLLLVYCVLSWFLPPSNRILSFLSRMFEPLLVPVRRLILRFTQNVVLLSFAPLVLLLLFELVTGLLTRAMLLF